MDRPAARVKIVYCPSCHEKIFPHWNNAVGVYRGWCEGCQSIVYVREIGEPWLSRVDKKWLVNVDNPVPPSRSRDAELRLNFLITESELVTIRDYLQAVWDVFIGVIIPRKNKSK